jgi:hypothetical protein
MLELPQRIETEREVNGDPDWPTTSAQKMSERMIWPLGPQVQEYRLQFLETCLWVADFVELLYKLMCKAILRTG